MDNQHKKITGYRDLSQEEIDLMNEAKALAEKCGELIEKLESHSSTAEPPHVYEAKIHIQTGFMWLIRSIAKPTTF